MDGTPSAMPSMAPATVPDMVTSSAMFCPRLTPERTRSGLPPSTRSRTPIITQSVGVPVMAKVLGSSFLQADRVGQRQRPAGARLLELRRHGPDVVGQLQRDAAEDGKAFGMNAVVVGEQYPHLNPLIPAEVG